MISTIFDLSFGEILSVFSGDRPLPEEMPVNSAWVDGEGDWATQYIVDGVISDRPNFMLTLSPLTVSTQEPITISNIPVGTKINSPAGELIIDDPQDTNFSISFMEPGSYTIELSLWPYRPEVINAECVA